MTRYLLLTLLMTVFTAWLEPAPAIAGGPSTEIEVSYEHAYRGYFLFKRHPHLARKYPSLAREFGGKLVSRDSAKGDAVASEPSRKNPSASSANVQAETLARVD
jgi:hypothetical protein